MAIEKVDDETREAISMISEVDFDDIEIGRMSEGTDPNEFDQVPSKEAEFDSFDAESLAGEGPFQSVADHFPIFRSALRYFRRAAPKPRAVRVDTEETYLGFACDQAVKEIDRRLRELRQAVEEHVADHHGPEMSPLSSWDVIGALRTIHDLRGADSPAEAVAKLEQVPLDLPEFAKGKVQCWRDGDAIICSLTFSAADGSKRIATSAARPTADEDEVAGAAMRAGVDPMFVLGALPDLAALATGKRLVREVAGAALKARARDEVLGMDSEPVMLATKGAQPDEAPLAALMYLKQRADRGDKAAAGEWHSLERVSQTDVGRHLAAPVLHESKRRLDEGRTKKSFGSRLLAKYASAAGWV